MITQDRLKELLNYDPDNGIFTWKIKTNKVNIGDIAGNVSVALKGYVKIGIDKKQYWAHRLAFLYITGSLPKEHVDHIDGNPNNNKWDNLRSCSRNENYQNRSRKKNSTSKYLGVSWGKKSNKWQSRIQVNGKVNYLGCFDTEESAYAAYCDEKKVLHTFNPIVRS
jgi:hypothetical protein